MDIFNSIIIGFIQGICEFLPLSSRAHQTIISWLTDKYHIDDTAIYLAQIGSLLALIVYFLKEWLSIIKAGFLSIIERHIGLDEYRKEFWIVVISFVPLIFSFLVFKNFLDNMGHLIIAIWFCLLGFLLYFFDTSSVLSKNIDEMKIGDFLLLAMFNSIAIIPGIGTITPVLITARFLGFTREACLRISILITMPVLVCSNYHNIEKIVFSFISYRDAFIVIISSFLFGLLSIKLLSNFSKKRNYSLLAWYRILAGTSIVFLSLLLKK